MVDFSMYTPKKLYQNHEIPEVLEKSLVLFILGDIKNGLYKIYSFKMFNLNHINNLLKNRVKFFKKSQNTQNGPQKLIECKYVTSIVNIM